MTTQPSGGSADLGSVELPEALGGKAPEAKADGGTSLENGKKPETPPEGTKEVKPEAKPEGEEPDKAVLRAEEKAHLAALDTIGIVMSDKYTDKEKAEFFSEHPELANIANRSKKYKESYRSLVEKNEKGELEEAKKPEPEKKPKKGKEEEEYLELDEDELINKVSTKLQEDNLKLRRKEKAYDFAVSQGLSEDEFANLHKVSEAILSANPELDYSKAMQSAMVSMGKEVKSQPVKLPQGESDWHTPKPKENPDEEIKRIMETTRVDKDLATKIYNSGKNLQGDITGEGVTMPTDF